MTTLDWIIAAIIALGIWSGFRAGLVKSIIGTVGLVFAFLLATALMGPVGRVAVDRFGVSEQLAPLAGFIAVFVGVLGGLLLVGSLFRAVLETVKLSLFESVGGGFVGGLKAAFLLSVFFLATSAAPYAGAGPWLITEETRAASRLYGSIEPLAPAAWDVLRDVAPGIREEARERFRAAEPLLSGNRGLPTYSDSWTSTSSS